MLLLSNAIVVTPDRVLAPGSVVVDRDRIVEVREGRLPAGTPDSVDLAGRLVLPGFIDVHVHGVGGVDTLDGPEAVAAIAADMPRHGVTAFSPTTVACPADALSVFLESVERARTGPAPRSARVLPAHLESNFINVDYRGAQPSRCLLLPPRPVPGPPGSPDCAETTAEQVLRAIEDRRASVSVVTLAPELPGGLPLVDRFVRLGIQVSLGHSGADYETAMAAIDEGARRGTHLFNRMPPLHHRKPGLAAALLDRDEVFAEIICDGCHVHPAMVRLALARKGRGRLAAITDGTAGSGMPVGSQVRLGGQNVRVAEEACHLPDGTLAGSAATMAGVFAVLVGRMELSLIEAAHACATAPAAAAGVAGMGAIAAGNLADLVVLDRDLAVIATYVGGTRVF